MIDRRLRVALGLIPAVIAAWIAYGRLDPDCRMIRREIDAELWRRARDRSRTSHASATANVARHC